MRKDEDVGKELVVGGWAQHASAALEPGGKLITTPSVNCSPGARKRYTSHLVATIVPPVQKYIGRLSSDVWELIIISDGGN